MNDSKETPRPPLRLSIIIVNWNTRQLLLDALATFLPIRGIEAEVIIVDNASTDGSAEAVEDAYPELRVIRSATNLGFAGGVNVGFRAASAPLVLLLNTDTLVIEDAIEKLIEYADAHPEAGIIGPKVLNRDQSLQRSYFQYPSPLNLFLLATYLYKAFPRSAFFNQGFCAGLDPDRPARVEAVSGCCFLIRREVLDRVGGFDEGYFMYCEETDLCYRAAKAGFEVHYAPVGRIIHFGGGSSKLASRRMFIEFRKSLLLFARKHRGPFARVLVRLWMALFLVVRVPFWLFVGLISSGEKRSRAWHNVRNYLAGLYYVITARIRDSDSKPTDVRHGVDVPLERSPVVSPAR
jgi:GT2 family glycosyltransferase